jgi:hypothetical protein
VTRHEILKIAARLYRGLPVTTEILRTRYGCSAAGAKRVLRELEDALPVTVEMRERGQRVLRIQSANDAPAPVSATPKLPPRRVNCSTWMPR